MQLANSYQMSVLMGFDFGLRRIGVAVGQQITGTASPLMPVKAQEGIPDWQVIGGLMTEWKPVLVLVGEPINMDGSDSAMAARARKFARRVQGRFGARIIMVDERLSSHDVKQRVRQQYGAVDFADHAVDSAVAALLIEQWLHENSVESCLRSFKKQ